MAVVRSGADPAGDELQPPSPPARRHQVPHAVAPICTEEETGGADEDEMSSLTPSVSADALLLPPLLRVTVVRSSCLLAASSTDTLRPMLLFFSCHLQEIRESHREGYRGSWRRSWRLETNALSKGEWGSELTPNMHTHIQYTVERVE
jgi:hypothetical protein